MYACCFNLCIYLYLMQRILIIQTAFLGDVILATPIASELKRIYPSASIDFLVKKGNESLLSNNPNLHEVFIFDKQKGKYRSMLQLIKTFRRNRYDLVINLHRYASSGLITVLSGAQKKYGFAKNPLSLFYTQKFEHKIGNGKHEVERNLSLIQAFGAAAKLRPSLYPSQEDEMKIKTYISEPFITMAPSSVWFTKMLPQDKWIALIKSFPKTQKIFLLGGKSDEELCNSIKEQTETWSVVNLAGELGLLASAALMEKAQRNYVNDSGPLHIASAMNAPTTAFFCSTVPDFGFGPLADDAQVKQVENLSCKPCGIHGHHQCPKGHFDCGHLMKL